MTFLELGGGVLTGFEMHNLPTGRVGSFVLGAYKYGLFVKEIDSPMIGMRSGIRGDIRAIRKVMLGLSMFFMP